MFQREYDEYIDLMDLFKALMKKVWVLILSGLLFAFIGMSVTEYCITPKYMSSSTIYIFTKTTSITSLADFQIGTQLAEDFQILATSRPVLERVINDLNLDIKYEELLSKVVIENPGNTRLLQIKVTDTDPIRATDIANAAAEALADRVSEIMDTEKPSIAVPAVVPVNKSSPNLVKNVAVFGLAGVVLSACIIVLFYLLDNTLKTENDVVKYLNTNVLANLPKDYEANKNLRKKSKKKSSH